jgi:hypothetical protein
MSLRASMAVVPMAKAVTVAPSTTTAAHCGT